MRTKANYFRLLGYSFKYNETVDVRVSDLETNSNKKVLCRCDKCSAEFERQLQLLNKQQEHLCYECARKRVGEIADRTNIDAATKSRTGENHPRWNPNKPAFKEYSSKVRKITEETYAKHKDEINPRNYPRTLCGVAGGYQLDHKVSVKKGFMFGINPVVIGSLDNLQMLPWAENLKKHA